MITENKHSQAQVTGVQRTAQASIVMTPEMFQMLSCDIYTDKPLAVVRETICNARDAHIISDEDRPLLVHLPNQLEKYFSIQDFGTGLSEDDIMTMYLVYGDSTKRGTNKLIGGKGIGSKSPLAYTDSFMVTSNFEGMKSIYSIYKDEGMPTVSLMGSPVPTTDPTGLTVRVAIASEDFDLFYTAFNQFNKFFDFPIDVVGVHESKLIKSPKSIIETSDYTTYESNSYYTNGKVKALMGGVAYSISDKYLQPLSKIVKQDFMVLNFGIGDLEIAPSREALSENKDTIAKIKVRVEEVEKNFYANIQGLLDDNLTPHEAFRLLWKYDIVKNGEFGSDKLRLIKACESFTYNDSPMDDLFDASKETIRVIRDANYSGKHSDKETRLRDLAHLDKCTFLKLDSVRGMVMTSRKVSKNTAGNVVIYTDSSLDKLERWFGKGNFTTELMSVKYEELFPKVEREKNAIAVARSGLYTLDMAEVRELEPESEGYAFMFNRDNLIMPDAPTGLLTHLNLEDMRRFVGRMKDHGGDPFKGADLYICRKGGLSAIDKTKIKRVDFKMFAQLVGKCYSKGELKQYITIEAEPSNQGLLQEKSLQDINDSVKKLFPLYAQPRKQGERNSGVKFLSYTGHSIMNYFIGTLADDIENMEVAYGKERAAFRKMLPILDHVPMWRMDEESIADLKELLLIRIEKVKAEKLASQQMNGTNVLTLPKTAVQ